MLTCKFYQYEHNTFIKFTLNNKNRDINGNFMPLKLTVEAISWHYYAINWNNFIIVRIYLATFSQYQDAKKGAASVLVWWER